MRQVSRLLLITSILCVAAAAFPAAHARADDEGGAGGTAGAYVDAGGNPTAEAKAGGAGVKAGGSGGGGSGSAAPSNCKWSVVNPDDNQVAMYDESGRQLHSDTGRWISQTCGGEPAAAGGAFAVPERSQTADPAALAQQARNSVSIAGPPMATSPQADRKLFTRVLTWLWIDGGWWRSYSATATAEDVSSTVVATPVRAIWKMGDGGETVCNGPGVEWRPGMADDQTYCSYVYKNSSAAEVTRTYTLTVTVEFDVTWSSSTGAGGTLPQITRSASRAVEVGEIQAIETQ